MSPRRRIALMVLVAAIVPALLDGSGTALQARIAGHPISWRLVVWQASEWLIFGALTPLAFAASRRYPLAWPLAPRHLLWHAANALLLCLLWATVGLALRWLLGLSDASDEGHIQWLSWLINSIPWSVFMYFSVAGSVHALQLWQDTQRARQEAEQLQSQLTSARLSALQRQLHPHFLFNSLNAIAVLVRDGEVGAAEQMLQRLSHLLRSVLKTDSETTVALSDDLQLAMDYLAIEQVRFADQLTIDSVVPERLLKDTVPILTLQPLVENAIRHGIAPHDRSGCVRIVASRVGDALQLEVVDDGPIWKMGQNPGIGMNNINERLRSLYGAEAWCRIERRGNTTVATVRVPQRGAGA